MTRSAVGKCLCGDVRFEAQDVPETFGVCHCEMCRRWTGSALLEVSIPEQSVVWHGKEHIATRQTSEWAERGWCRNCGTGLFYRVTMAGEWSGSVDIPLGIFDDPNGLVMSHEIYIDFKPDSFAYAGEGRKQLTRQQCVEKFSLLGNDPADASQGRIDQGETT